MNKIKTNYFELSIPEKIQKGYNILDSMQDNPHFPDAASNLNEFKAVVQKLEETHKAAFYGDRVKGALKVLADQSMNDHLNGLGGYVQSVALGDLEKVLSSGFELVQPRTKSSPQPVNIPAFLRIMEGRLPGEVVFKWDRVYTARSYSPQISEDNGQTWKDGGVTTRSKITVSGLAPGSKPWFRVCAFGVLGHSDWSEAIQTTVAY